MHAEELSRSAISAEVATDIAVRLDAVRARIAEIEAQLPALRETEAWLEGVLAAVGPEAGPEAGAEPVAAPTPGQEAAPEAVAADVTVPAPRREAKPARAARAAKPAKPAKAPKAPRATRRKAAEKAPAATGAAPSLPARVLAFLSARPDPQKTSEIAQELFGAEATTVQTNLARGAAEALVRRGQAEKAKQGATVFYQAQGQGAASGAVVEAGSSD
ncbi:MULTISPECIES: hypothetical protein [Streptacidiphilus]|uniref:MarR family transcriptional regulator n=1 Tax=Streptacidiphilus cavernicola TaxID=3342716 RepID=A0ABV6UHW4_9ACTN|nr:hypothetical protein [Streptacidiphilus jeojiense]